MLVHLMAIWNMLLTYFYKCFILDILWPFGNLVVIRYLFPVWVFCIKKNLATLLATRFLKNRPHYFLHSPVHRSEANVYVNKTFA
jgi:hypothetical protein